MTKEEKLKILEEAEHRAYTQIQATPGEEMGEEKFLNLLDAANKLIWLVRELEFPCTPELPVTGFTGPALEAVPTPKHAEVRVGAEPYGEEEFQSEPAPEPEPDPQPTYTKDQMVTKLTRYIDEQGVNVNAVMSEMGFAKLSQIPADRYQELLDKCEAAVEGNA